MMGPVGNTPRAMTTTVIAGTDGGAANDKAKPQGLFSSIRPIINTAMGKPLTISNMVKVMVQISDAFRDSAKSFFSSFTGVRSGGQASSAENSANAAAKEAQRDKNVDDIFGGGSGKASSAESMTKTAATPTLTPQQKIKNMNDLCEIIKDTINNRNTDGLFRKPGSAATISALRAELATENGLSVKMKEKLTDDENVTINQNIHAYCSIVKTELRECSPIDTAIFQKMKNDPNQAASILKTAVELLPEHEQTQFNQLMDFLADTYRSAPDNNKEGFTQSSVQLSLGLSLFTKLPDITDMAKAKEQTSEQNNFTKIILANWNKPAVTE